MASVTGHERIYPSDVTVALALTIAKTKPPDQTMKAYASCLQRYIIRTSSGSSQRPPNYMDVAGYWRSRSAQIQDQLESAEKDACDLRLRLGALQTGPEPTGNSGTGTKRKRTALDSIASQPTFKKSKSRVKLSKNSVQHEQDTPVQILLPDLCRLQNILQNKGTSESGELVECTCRSAETLSKILSHVVSSFCDQSQCLQEFKNGLDASYRVFSMLITACRKISQLHGGTSLQDRPIFALVQVLEDVMKIVKDKAYTAHTGTERSQLRRSVNSRVATVGTTLRDLTRRNNNVLEGLTALVGNVIDLLDPHNNVDGEIFEGLAYCILSRIGDQLFAIVFHHKRGETLETEIIRSKVFRRVESELENTTTLDTQIKSEAPHLVALLKRITCVAPLFFDTQPNHDSSKQTDNDNTPKTKSLTDVALTRLQQTLVNSIFGVDSGEWEDTLIKSLRMPKPDRAQPEKTLVTDSNPRDWFTEQIWTVLGWQILSK